MLRMMTILALLLLLNACATIPQTSIETLNELPLGSGLVVAETLTNSDIIAGRLDLWDELILWKENAAEGEKDTYALKALGRHTEAQQYAGAVPEGKYRLGLLWASFDGGDYSVWARAIAPPVFGTFEVKANRVTSLGKILYHPFQIKTALSNELPDYALTRAQSPDLWQRLKPSMKSFSAQITEDVPFSWDDNGYEKELGPLAHKLT